MLDHLLETADGALSVERRYENRDFLWVGDGSVPHTAYKVDALSHAIAAGYQPSPAGLDYPYAIAIDRVGNAVLGFTDPPAVTKIAVDAGSCLDRNGNGLIETSTRWDDVLAFTGPDNWLDECILWRTVGLASEVFGVVTYEAVVDTQLDERLWVSLRHAESLVELESETGEPTGREIATPGVHPRESTLDRDGRVWVLGEHGSLVAFDAAEPEGTVTSYSHLPCGFHMAIDEEGSLWQDSDRGGTNLWRVDPLTEEADGVWDPDERDGAGYKAVDPLGGIWVAGYLGDAGVYRVDVDTLDFEWFELPWDLAETVGVDFHGQVWVLAFENTPGAWVIDDETHEASGALEYCDSYCSARPPFGDFTGMAGALTRDELGLWTGRATACAGDEEVVWSDVRGSARLPANSSISIWVKTAAAADALAAAPWIQAGGLVDGDSLVALQPLLRDRSGDHHLAVQARLATRYSSEAPLLERLEITWGCQEPLR